MSEPIWVNPALIRFKISPQADLKPVQPGNWDLERRYLLAEAVKHISIRQRYDEGRKWEDTDLFRDTYRRRFDAGGTVRGAATWEALVAQYYDRVDGLFADMRHNGFRADARTFPTLLIGRNGEVFIGNQGNHRLAIAQVLGLEKIAGKVICRHPLSPR
jgi:protein-disulfide isomerase-like protein with CxxC motif